MTGDRFRIGFLPLVDAGLVDIGGLIADAK